MSSPDQFLAFISYARKDNMETGRRWADWVQESVVGFEVPPALVGKETALGPLPTELPDVFLDRLHLSVGSQLDPALEQALEKSRFLLVICSPRAAESKWVNIEVERFAKLHGTDRIIPILVDGNHRREARDCGVPEALFKVLGDDFPLAVDFRVKDPEQKKRWGFTEPSLLSRELKREGRYSKAVIDETVATYERDHRDNLFKLLGALTGLSPAEAGVESLQKVNERQKARMARLLWAGATAVLLAAVAFVAALMIDRERRETEEARRVAEDERQKAERSLLMIGDAHNRTTELAGDLLVVLRQRLNQLASANPDGVLTVEAVDGILREAEQTARNYFDPSRFSSHDEDLHARSVVLNSRGEIEGRLGDFDRAKETLQTALEIRKDLLERDPKNPLYLHDLAISTDNLGDLYYRRAPEEGDRFENYVKALEYYREGLRLSVLLSGMPEAPAFAPNDVAVSHYKIAAILSESGEPEEALEELLKGVEAAEEAAKGSPGYVKWEAHHALFCLRIGELYVELVRDEEASPFLTKGKAVLGRLEEAGKLTPEYAAWLQQIDHYLETVGGQGS